ncbi:MAG: hypothetical protein GQ579_10020 [Bacteroidales bacterium]|nr:hypothetical protein [Bacteroidales bacterium]
MLFCFCTSCGFHMSGPSAATGPVVVYKTKKDYRAHVTVQLSADGKTITAFPASSDARMQKPVQLADGYLLKRMVGDAYLSLTIEAYADTSHIYTVKDLLALVIDREPYLEMYDCSGCTSPDTASINKLIRKGELKNCSSLLK